ncbi:site-specific DNA-methyltransferase [Acinetobacter sp. FL51]|uniref:site-specific DNA-methyltransferase n=1 Tax=Acinetobacter sp. FL51 TaxID=2777978 RepID=UPI0018E1D391|nr:site-specific DNA-methyltransferase [Acinetobacter sp. FL51]MBI1451048.1 site-specific DNA-methyltransferase [Acinetobacter sp. FL51]
MPLLDWVNRNQAEETATQVPYHLLKFEQAYGDTEQAKENLIIQGDNLQALKALLPLYGGQVKCIFIDPPYNTQTAFEHYDDKLEHAQWLSMMYPRLQLLKELLAEDGVFYVQIDDKEMPYLKLICDEVFGRRNFLNTIVVKTSDPSGHKTVNPSPYSQTEYILMYAKNREIYKYEIQYVEADYDSGYNKYITNINENFEKWDIVNLNEYVAQLHGYNNTREARKQLSKVGFNSLIAQFALENSEAVYQATAISNDAGRGIVEIRDESKNYTGKVFYYPRDEHDDLYILNGRQIYFYSSKIKVIDGRSTPAKPLTNLWGDIPYNGIANEGQVEFKNGKKPEKLLRRCIEIATDESDLILDSFLGSGTTAAVAHKMGRRYIGIEMGEQAKTHVIPRLEKVIEGEQGGISKSLNWQGGGGFSFYTLGSSVFDDNGFLNADVKFKDLASYIWWLETKSALNQTENFDNPFLGIHEGTAYYLLYNGILGDRRPNGGNVLTSSVLNHLNECHAHDGKRIVIGEASRLSPARLESLNIEFKQIPYSLYGNKAK